MNCWDSENWQSPGLAFGPPCYHLLLLGCAKKGPRWRKPLGQTSHCAPNHGGILSFWKRNSLTTSLNLPPPPQNRFWNVVSCTILVFSSCKIPERPPINLKKKKIPRPKVVTGIKLLNSGNSPLGCKGSGSEGGLIFVLRGVGSWIFPGNELWIQLMVPIPTGSESPVVQGSVFAEWVGRDWLWR